MIKCSASCRLIFQINNSELNRGNQIVENSSDNETVLGGGGIIKHFTEGSEKRICRLSFEKVRMLSSERCGKTIGSSNCPVTGVRFMHQSHLRKFIVIVMMNS